MKFGWRCCNEKEKTYKMLGNEICDEMRGKIPEVDCSGVKIGKKANLLTKILLFFSYSYMLGAYKDKDNFVYIYARNSGKNPIDASVRVINHEFLHKILYETESEKACRYLDIYLICHKMYNSKCGMSGIG